MKIIKLIKDLGLDEKNGFSLEIVELASKNAAAVALQGGAVDLMGRPVRFFSRTDPLVERFRANGPVLPVRSLRGSRVLYIATNCSAYRYGPFRDVHPATYMQWQMKLLTWLEEQTGKRPLVRLHPKRRTHRYDPPNFKMMDGDLCKVF